MQTLKTIVATAAIVFAGTTLAHATVNHFEGNSHPAKAPHSAKVARRSVSVNMTGAQLRRFTQMMNGNWGRQQTGHARAQRATHGSYRTVSRQTSGSRSTGTYNGYHCPWYGNQSHTSTNTYHSGSSGGSSHGGSWAGCGCGW